MILSIHQPAYLPWLGYFHKIYLSDIFVYLDDTQFEKNSFINRNKIKTAQGESWLTVPVNLKEHFQNKIYQTVIADKKWQKNHWQSIELNYKKTKYWSDYSDLIRSVYLRDYQYISDLCFDQLNIILKILEIKTKVIKSTDLKILSKKDDLVLDICKELSANIYVSGKLGKDYINEDKFIQNNIKLYFQDYIHPIYDQIWGDFKPFMSVIDLIFNQGPKSLDIILKDNLSKENLINN